MAKVKRRSAARFIDQAAADAVTRFGGTREQLNQLLSQAHGEYAQSVNAARGSAAVTQQAVDKALPQVATSYRDALARRQALTASLDTEAAGAGPYSPSIAAAIALEKSGGAGRLVDAQTQEETDLRGRRVRAAEGATYAKLQAGAKLSGDLESIYGKKTALTGQENAYTQSQAEKYANQDFGDQIKGANLDLAGQRVDIAQQNANTSAANAKQRAADKNKPKLRTSEQHGSFLTQVAELKLQADRLKKHGGHSRGYVAKQLLTGRPAMKIDPKTGNVDPKGVALPAIPKAKDVLALSVALDQAYNPNGGALSAKQVKRLHDAGYSVAHLNFATQRGVASKKRK